MATPYYEVYKPFFSKILSEEWDGWTAEEVSADVREILEAAIPHFKFPKVSLERNDDGFLEDLSSSEIQILTQYMRLEWYDRMKSSWEVIGTLYDERDYSPANFLDKLNNSISEAYARVEKLEDIYYRSINGKPFKYGDLWGGN